MTLDMTVKFAEGSDTVIEGYGVPFGLDLDGQQFTAKTDRCHEWFPKGGRPVLYHHGFNDAIKMNPVGWELSTEPRDEGDWVRAELDKASKYYDRVAALVREGKVGWSSAAPDHKVKIADDGTIEQWPVIEYSLTPTPAFPNQVAFSMKSAQVAEVLSTAKNGIPDPLADIEQTQGDPEPESLADQSERVVAGLKAWAERMEERSDFRVKYGRELSKANVATLRDAQQIIAALLERVDGEAKAEEDGSKAFADWLKLEAELSGI